MSVLTLAANPERDRTDTVPLWLRAPAMPAQDLGEYRLEPMGDGFSYEERTFTARIARDGAVTLFDRRIFFDRLGLLPRPLPGAQDGETLVGLLFSRPRATPRPLPLTEQGPWPGSPADPLDMALLCPERSTCYALPGLLVIGGVGVAADLSDEIMRALGQDPYRVQKAQFLAATFEVRMRLAVQAHQDDLRVSLDELPERLASLWHDPRYSLPERRHLLFELWRETDESEEGARARALILTFIQRILPCESPQAYPPAELRALQASLSEEPFLPYGECGR